MNKKGFAVLIHRNKLCKYNLKKLIINTFILIYIIVNYESQSFA